MNAKESTSLVVGQQYALSTAPPLGELLNETFGAGETLSVFDLPAIKVPAGGGQSWELPDGETAKSFSGVLVYRSVGRVYWRDAFGTGDGALPPDCRSDDGSQGVGVPGGTCATCDLNKWGTAVGSDGQARPGKACRELNRLFIIRENDFLPSVLTCPPSALAAIRYYLVTLLASGTSHWAVETTIGLERNTATGGINYAVPTFTRGGSLDPVLLERIDTFRSELIPFLRQTSVVGADGRVDTDLAF